MGQCPVNVPEGGYTLEEITSAATPIYKSSCQPFALTLAEWSASIGYRNTPKQKFLKVHKPDRSQKWILEPGEVQKALEMQTEELLRRDGYSVGQQGRDEAQYCSSDDEDAGNCFGGTSMVTNGVGHEYAKSEITTWSAATQRVVNGDKNTSTNSRNTRRNFSVMDAINQDGVRQTTSFEIDDSDDENRSHRPKSQTERRVPFDTKELRTTSSSMLANYFQAKTEVQKSTDGYTALHLRLKAKLVDYYVNTYLPTFPESPIPKGLARYLKRRKKMDEVPNLVASEDLDDCASQHSHSIDYGSIPPSASIKFLALDRVFMDLALTGSLGLSEPRSPSRSSSSSRGDRKSPSHYIVLMNQRSGTPLAVCALKANTVSPVVRIFTTKQRVFGQRPAASTRQLGLNWANNLPLYSWAEIVAEGDLPRPVQFAIYMASGSDGKFTAVPNYRAIFLANGSPEVKVVGRTDRERHDTGSAMISLEATPDGSDLFYHLSIAQGIDPALMMCFTAVFDEVMDRAMRRATIPR